MRIWPTLESIVPINACYNTICEATMFKAKRVVVYRGQASCEEDASCKGWYGTVAVAELAEQCDMKEEVMETLLSYLEVAAWFLQCKES